MLLTLSFSNALQDNKLHIRVLVLKFGNWWREHQLLLRLFPKVLRNIPGCFQIWELSGAGNPDHVYCPWGYRSDWIWKGPWRKKSRLFWTCATEMRSMARRVFLYWNYSMKKKCRTRVLTLILRDHHVKPPMKKGFWWTRRANAGLDGNTWRRYWCPFCFSRLGSPVIIKPAVSGGMELGVRNVNGYKGKI